MRALATGLLLLLLPLCGCSIGRTEASATSPTRPYAVLVVFDEFPGDTLLGPDGRIDPGGFPNFAALAADGTWAESAGPALAAGATSRSR